MVKRLLLFLITGIILNSCITTYAGSKTPKDATDYNNRGDAYYNKGEYDRAIKDYTQAITLDPKDAAAYNNRGLAYKHKGEYQKARRDWEKAVELDPYGEIGINARRLLKGMGY